MANKTVAVYDNEEFENSGIAEAITTKNGRNSVLLPLILSILAAAGLWLFVIGSNNTVSDVSVEVLGTDRLMYSNLSVASVYPPTVDIVLRGDSDAISRIKKDKTQIAATVNLFEEAGIDHFVFSKDGQIAEGKYTVSLNIVLPDGVECSSKTVEVTIVASSSVTFNADEIEINKTNYSFANGYSLGEETVNNQTVTVIGNSETVSSIHHIALDIDWLKDITGDVNVEVVPVAYDVYGGKIDSKFLRFEPEQVNVSITVNKKKPVSLAVLKPEEDQNDYRLSIDTATLFGPASLVDLMPDVLYVNEDQDFTAQPEVLSSYTLEMTSFGGKLYFYNNETGAHEKSLTVQVKKITADMRQDILVSKDFLTVKLPEGFECTVGTQFIELQVKYLAESEVLTETDIRLFADLTDLGAGKHTVTPVVYFKSDIAANDIKVIHIGSVEITLTETDAQERQ